MGSRRCRSSRWSDRRRSPGRSGEWQTPAGPTTSPDRSHSSSRSAWGRRGREGYKGTWATGCQCSGELNHGFDESRRLEEKKIKERITSLNIMLNGLLSYSAFLTTSNQYCLTFTHSCTHSRQSQPRRVTASSSGAMWRRHRRKLNFRDMFSKCYICIFLVIVLYSI